MKQDFKQFQTTICLQKYRGIPHSILNTTDNLVLSTMFKIDYHFGNKSVRWIGLVALQHLGLIRTYKTCLSTCQTPAGCR